MRGRGRALAAAGCALLAVAPCALVGIAYRASPLFRGVVDDVFPRHDGVVVAAPGMDLAGIRAGSTSSLTGGFVYGDRTSLVKQGLFDFQLANSSVVFRDCRIMKLEAVAQVVENIQVSVSPGRLPWSRATVELLETQAKLESDGWSPKDDAVESLKLVVAAAPHPLGTHGFVWRKGDLELSFGLERHDGGKYVQSIAIVTVAPPGVTPSPGL